MKKKKSPAPGGIEPTTTCLGDVFSAAVSCRLGHYHSPYLGATQYELISHKGPILLKTSAYWAKALYAFSLDFAAEWRQWNVWLQGIWSRWLARLALEDEDDTSRWQCSQHDAWLASSLTSSSSCLTWARRSTFCGSWCEEEKVEDGFLLLLLVHNISPHLSRWSCGTVWKASNVQAVKW